MKKTILLAFVLLTASAANLLAQEYTFQRSLGHAPLLGEPRGLVVDKNDNVFISDRVNGQVLVLASSNQLQKGRFKTAQPLSQPSAIALNQHGELVVAEEGTGKVHTFSSAGVLHQSFSAAEKPGMGINASGMAVDGNGYVYVSDQFRNQVQKFNSAGQLVASLGKQGQGPGEFAGPRGLAVDSAGNLFIADEFNNRIQKFDADGKFVGQSTAETLGSTVSSGLGPMSVALDSKGNMWIAAHTNFAVYKLDPSFKIIARLEAFGRRDGELAGPIAVAVDSKDNVLVLDNTRRIQKFDSKGNFISKFAFPPAAAGEISAPTGLAVDAEGNYLICDTANFRIQKFDTRGRPMLVFGQFGQGIGEFNGAESIAIDRENNFFIVDHYNHRVQKFDSKGKFLFKFGSFGNREGEFNRVKVVAVDPSGDHVYVNDWTNARVQEFDLNGKFIAQLGNTGAPQTRPLGPTGLAVDKAGNVYVSSWYNNVIQKFDAKGNFVKSIGSQGTGDGQFKGPARLAIDAENHLIVADWGNSRIQILDLDGNFITKFGSLGTGPGSFNQPVGVAVGHHGEILVSDASNARVQVFIRSDKSARKPPAGLKPASLTNTTPQQSSPFVAIAIYDLRQDAGSFDQVLRSAVLPLTNNASFVNLRLLKNMDTLASQYALYAKTRDRAAAERIIVYATQAVRPFLRRMPETHIAELKRSYSPAGVTERPQGNEFGAHQNGQVAHLGLFIPFPQFRPEYDRVLHDTKVMTIDQKPRGYIGEDVLDETEALPPEKETPYSPRPVEASPMSFNYGEYNTMEDAEDSYIDREEAHNPKLVTMERIFYSALQVPTRFYIFQVIDNLSFGAGLKENKQQASLSSR
jgi:DNA-binding beta-propeller fold protein YncE